MMCEQCGSTEYVEIHHIQYRSTGGLDHPSNCVALCKVCHTRLHSERGDYAVWGSLGGKTTASKRWYVNNLKQFKNPSVKERYLQSVGA